MKIVQLLPTFRSMYARGFILFAKTLAHADANRNAPTNACQPAQSVAAYAALDCVKSINPPLLRNENYLIGRGDVGCSFILVQK